ncbi:hypothetical protein ACERII_23110 [Evansella sp. AB-rgal1]|uniref:hypothetical protein n=1 Tax=Evansella sp. AB-rgal1 TaxID=3242696 RepID=UPI00359E6637
MGRIILYSVFALILFTLMIKPIIRNEQELISELGGSLLIIHNEKNPLLEARHFVFPKRLEVVTLMREEQVVDEDKDEEENSMGEMEEVLTEPKEIVEEKEVIASSTVQPIEKEVSLEKQVEENSDKTTEQSNAKEHDSTEKEKPSQEVNAIQLLSQLEAEFISGIFATKVFQYEMLFSQNEYKGDILSANETKFLKGNHKSNILITAPHTTSHIRDIGMKVADVYTGSMSLLLHEYTGVHVLYSTKEARDGNFYNDVEFKRELARIVQEHNIVLVIDLHGAARSRPFQVDIGTANGTTIGKTKVEKLTSVFQQNGINPVYENHTFSAGSSANIANYSRNQLGVEGVQLEFNRNLRDPRVDMKSFYTAVYSLAEYLESQ